MARQQGVYVEGLDELRRELKRTAGNLEDLKVANRQVSELVADKARSRAAQVGGVAGHVARQNSIRSSSAAAAAKVLLGGAADKHGPALGAEFGSKNYPQFEPWRGSDESAGYFLWPTIRAERERIVEVYGQLLDELTRKAFPDP